MAVVLPDLYGSGVYGAGAYGGGTFATTAYTDRIYNALPEHYRDVDAELGNPLLSFISLIGDQANEVENLLNRIGYTPLDDGGAIGDTSALADPLEADEAWLPWLGRLVGVVLPVGVTGQAARDAVAGAVNGFQVGTKGAIADAARSALIGTRYVKVYDHSIATVGDGGVWDMLIVTRTSETPDVPAVLAAVAAKGAKPAGVVLHHVAYSATYTEVQGATTPDTYAGRQTRFATYQDASDYLP